MKNLLWRINFVFILIALSITSCHKQIDEPVNEQEASNIRMPFNQQLYLLNSTNKGSVIYEIDYDFQGLEDEAYLTEMKLTKNGRPFTIPRGGHMCISPKNDYITVVVSRKKKIYLVEIATKKVREIQLFTYDPEVTVQQMKANISKYRFRGKITQVDVDQDGYLFIAGKSGFYKVVADWGSAKNGGADIWNDKDPSLAGTKYAGQVWAHVVKFQFSGNIAVEGSEDEQFFEDDTYFEENEIQALNKVKFQGGDILFTQNSSETDGFEEQRLISFSQWKGGTAIYLNNMDWDWDDLKVEFNAGSIFGGLNAKIAEKMGGRVTGAALTGDNMVFTSHHFSEYLQLRTLNGKVVKDDVKMIILNESGEEINTLYHNWGDMASTQAFDKNSFNTTDPSQNSREIDGEYYDQWFRGELDGYQYAEVKLYRPHNFNYGVKDLSHDNYNVSKESRQNSANADLADFRKNASKFVSLGGEDGYVLMQLPNKVTVTDETTLQVVETSWGKKPYYEDVMEAWDAYQEKAAVYVHASYNGRYYEDGLEDSDDWVKIGDAYIANNEFHLAGDLPEGIEVSWIKIVDNGSNTGDGFDVNFVATYEKPLVKETLTEREILMRFYEATNGDNWVYSENWGSDLPVSEWFGITTNSDGKVIIIDLMGLNLNGTLIPELSQLEELNVLAVGLNLIQGELPLTYLENKNIREIYLFGNLAPIEIHPDFYGSHIMVFQ
ncbi:hypothetical protein [Flammeovirga sp. SubArs3]|uniref:hypothetical protein n=1 Tax=Flammeovirga sp. SubArs3 TaxID=2995316 RepID=UPI00248AB6BB|nr:hypothetical protein [Flammeovirga sp. SubArs3]